MRKAFKYRIYLTKGQRRILEQQLGECRWAYNETLAYRKHAYEEEKRTANWYETKRLLPDWLSNAKQKALLAKIHERIANRRRDFVHKLSRWLIDTYQLIVFEALAPQQIGASKGRGMRKSIMDVAWSQLISMSVAKAAEAGRCVILVNPRDTTKMCSSCGKLVEKTLSERMHSCPNCGLVMDRDRNAAINILHRGLQRLQT